MKKSSIIIILMLVLQHVALAQRGDNDTVKKQIADLVTKLKKNLNKADELGNKLSIKISHLNSISPFENADSLYITKKLDSIQTQLRIIDSVPLRKILNEEDQSNFDSEYNNFTYQAGRMDETLKLFSNSVGDILYAAQTDMMETKIEHFLTATGNFKQYLQSLTVIPPADLLKEIKALTDATDNKVVVNKRLIDSLRIYNEQQIPETQRKIGKVQKKTDTIITMLKRDTLPVIQYLVGAAYGDNIFGISYLHGIGNAKPIDFVGVEFIAPISSASAKNPGGFLLYGLRDDKLLIEAGGGYLKTNKSREDISWKVGLLYMPKKFGLGLSYSPLTNVGVQLAFSL